MDVNTCWILVYLCLGLSQNVTADNLTCLLGYSGDISELCTCEEVTVNSTIWSLNCDFGDTDSDFGINISDTVGRLMFKGKSSMAILGNITLISDTVNVFSIDIQANEHQFNISYNFLSNFPTLTTIRLHNCSISYVERRAFSDHINLTDIDISGNDYLRLEAVVDSLEGLDSPNLERLNLSGIHNAENMPTVSLSETFFERLSTTKLEVLDISWIRITLITGSFIHLDHLKVVNLTGTTVLGEVDCMTTLLTLNQIETVVCNLWPRLPRGYEGIIKLPEPGYRYRRSSHCDPKPLFNFTTQCWSMITSAKTLSLRHVDLDSFYIDFTQDTFCLEDNELLNFMLSGSRVSRQIGRFRGFNKLKYFDISELVSAFQGPTIRPDTFNDMPELEVLLIRGCRLYEFTSYELSRIVSENRFLKVIDMSNNRLTSLPLDMFATNENLEVVNISGNSITEFGVEFGSATNLSMLDLRSNKLKTITDAVFDDVRNISRNRTLTLYLQDNALQCSCDLVNLVPIVSNQSVIECEINGKVYLIGNYSETDLPSELYELCNPKTTGLSIVSLFGIAFGSVFFVSIILIIIFCISRRSGHKRNNLTLITLPIANQRRLQDPKFTVFLAYCYKDYEFAVEKLYPALNQRLKVLLKRKDDNLIIVNDTHFLPGINIDVLIANAIQDMMKT